MSGLLARVTVTSSTVSLTGKKIFDTAKLAEEATQSRFELRSEKLLPCRLKRDLQRLREEILKQNLASLEAIKRQPLQWASLV